MYKYRRLFECKSKGLDDLQRFAPLGCVVRRAKHSIGDRTAYAIETESDDVKLHRRIDKFVEIYDEGEMPATND